MDIKIYKDCFVPLENIDFYSSYNSNATRRDVEKKKKEGLVHNYTCGKKILSVVYLKSGSVLLSNTMPETISRRIAEAEGGKS